MHLSLSLSRLQLEIHTSKYKTFQCKPMPNSNLAQTRILLFTHTYLNRFTSLNRDFLPVHKLQRPSAVHNLPSIHLMYSISFPQHLFHQHPLSECGRIVTFLINHITGRSIFLQFHIKFTFPDRYRHAFRNSTQANGLCYTVQRHRQ